MRLNTEFLLVVRWVKALLVPPRHLKLQRRPYLCQLSRGFTLLEVLLALFIFTLIASVTAGALYTALHAEHAAKRQYQSLRELQGTVQRLRGGLLQFVDQPLRNLRSEQRLPSFAGDANHLSFTTTQDGIAGQFSYQTYAIKDTLFINQTWVHPNSVFLAAPPIERALLHHARVQFAYLDAQHHWQTDWKDKHAWPQAVKVTLQTQAGSQFFIFTLPEAPA